MSSFVISYDIKNKNRKRTSTLVSKLENIEALRVHFNTWVVNAPERVKVCDIYDYLMEDLTFELDRLFVCILKGKVECNSAIDVQVMDFFHKNNFEIV